MICVSEYIRRECQLKARIKELENIICPAEQHDWHDVQTWFTYGTPSDQTAVIEHNRQICKKCFAERTVQKE